ncbi:MAG: hypothetical protein H7Y18_13515 [Clostridiaceae bacterium]|nr:hypothetical protein [Clostridiaceae bacterium]
MDRQKKSHVDLEKLNKIPYGQSFEYKDIVDESFHPGNKAAIDVEKFKEEVEKAIYPGINVLEDKGDRLLYRKDEV